MRSTNLSVVAFLMWLATTLVWFSVKAEAKTYDPVADWSSSSNTAGGIWQYGTKTTIGGPLTLFSKHDSQATTPSYDWWSYDGTFLGPNVGLNNSGTTIMLPGAASDPYLLIWPANELLIAPGGKNGTPTITVLRWIAPATGAYDITGRWSDLQAATVSMAIMDGPTTLSTFGYSLPDHQPDLPFSLTGVLVTQGQPIDFLVNSGGNDIDDVLGISATITPSVPEPAGVAPLMIVLLATLMRRRKLSTFDRAIAAQNGPICMPLK
jgi:hypothetical protein